MALCNNAATYVMESLYFLIPLGLLILAVAVKCLFWAVQSGQYDDLEMEGQRILFDDDVPPKTSAEEQPGSQHNVSQDTESLT